jgi:hypothetical protein
MFCSPVQFAAPKRLYLLRCINRSRSGAILYRALDSSRWESIIFSSRFFFPDEHKVRIKMLFLIRFRVIDQENCVCKYGPGTEFLPWSINITHFVNGLTWTPFHYTGCLTFFWYSIFGTRFLVLDFQMLFRKWPFDLQAVKRSRDLFFSWNYPFNR